MNRPTDEQMLINNYLPSPLVYPQRWLYSETQTICLNIFQINPIHEPSNHSFTLK